MSIFDVSYNIHFSHQQWSSLCIIYQGISFMGFSYYEWMFISKKFPLLSRRINSFMLDIKGAFVSALKKKDFVLKSLEFFF